MESITINVPNSEATMQVITVPVISCDQCAKLKAGNTCCIDGEIIPADSLSIVTECYKLLN